MTFWCPVPSEQCKPVLRHLEALLSRGLDLPSLVEAVEILRWRARSEAINRRVAAERLWSFRQKSHRGLVGR